MSKIAEALKKVEEERVQILSPVRETDKFLNNYEMGGKMRKSWFVWGLIVVIVTVFIVFNYQEGKDAVPLSQIFPNEEVFPVDVEYEFVKEDTAAGELKETQTVLAEPQAAAAAVPEKTAEKTLVAVNSASVVYTIQIASFKDKKRADEALVAIRAKVPSAYIASRNLGAKGTWYRIYAGQFDRRSEAEVSLNNIKRDYDSSFIISPKSTK